MWCSELISELEAAPKPSRGSSTVLGGWRPSGAVWVLVPPLETLEPRLFSQMKSPDSDRLRILSAQKQQCFHQHVHELRLSI